MALLDKSTENFLHAIKHVDSLLLELGFKQYSIFHKGFATFVRYKRGETIVEFLYGPGEYKIEMVLHTQNGKFNFGELLLKIPELNSWVYSKQCAVSEGDNLIDDLLYYIEVLKISLPFIE